ncbi:unnamed protein product [Closterium sp. NIES-64]|nr:unnamed protein product [Closterium sp. NIES-64]
MCAHAPPPPPPCALSLPSLPLSRRTHVPPAGVSLSHREPFPPLPPCDLPPFVRSFHVCALFSPCECSSPRVCALLSVCVLSLPCVHFPRVCALAHPSPFLLRMQAGCQGGGGVLFPLPCHPLLFLPSLPRSSLAGCQGGDGGVEAGPMEFTLLPPLPPVCFLPSPGVLFPLPLPPSPRMSPGRQDGAGRQDGGGGVEVLPLEPQSAHVTANSRVRSSPPPSTSLHPSPPCSNPLHPPPSQDAKTVVVGWRYSRWSTRVCTWPAPRVSVGDVLVFKWNDWLRWHNLVGVDEMRYVFCLFGSVGTANPDNCVPWAIKPRHCQGH